jgi:hypothetical protein
MISPVKILRENFHDLDPPKIVQPPEKDLRVSVGTKTNRARMVWRKPEKFSPKRLDKTR